MHFYPKTFITTVCFFTKNLTSSLLSLSFFAIKIVCHLVGVVVIRKSSLVINKKRRRARIEEGLEANNKNVCFKEMIRNDGTIT